MSSEPNGAEGGPRQDRARVRAGGHDGVDAGALCTRAPHGRFDLGGNGSLGHPGPDGPDGRADTQLGDAVGLTDDRDLRSRLAGPQATHVVLDVHPHDAGQGHFQGR